MKDNRYKECALMLAAMAIIGVSLGYMFSRGKQRIRIKHSIESAVDAWEAEGGAVPLVAADAD